MAFRLLRVITLGISVGVSCAPAPEQPEPPPPKSADGDDDGKTVHAIKAPHGVIHARRACINACNSSGRNCQMACRQHAFACNTEGRPSAECSQVYQTCFAPCRFDRIRCRQACRTRN